MNKHKYEMHRLMKSAGVRANVTNLGELFCSHADQNFNNHTPATLRKVIHPDLFIAALFAALLFALWSVSRTTILVF